MYQAKEAAQEIKKFIGRRKRLLIISPILFITLAIIALQLIEPKYRSSTSILVQKEETLNPLVLYEMAVNIASEDRLKSFNEIIYSRSTIEMLIDSLGLDDQIQRESDRQALIAQLRKDITTTSRASDSFELSLQLKDPVKARDGVEILANHFIQARLRLENRRNNDTVEFFENKLEELEEVVEQQRSQATDATASRMRETPMETAALQNRLQEIDSQLDGIEWQIYQEEQKLEVLREYQEFSSDVNQQADRARILYRLPLDEIAFGEELAQLLREYDELRQQYTASFPRTRMKHEQILQTAERIPATVETNINQLNRQRSELVQQRSRVIEDVERSFISTQRANTQQNDFRIYEGLYNEMRVKLEQARMTRDIGNRSAEQFIVLDSPRISETPASPNSKLVLILGLFLGVVVGVIAAALAEVMDTTVRSEEQLHFDKPVIAYLTHG